MRPVKITLVERLRERGDIGPKQLFFDAADEIERLRKIEAAVKKLISAKGGYYSQEYGELEELLK